MTLEELNNIKKEDFESWSGIAGEFFIDYKNSFLRKSYRISAFYLHQCAESYLTCYLLVKT
jgi:HEPN domain-containing protein